MAVNPEAIPIELPAPDGWKKKFVCKTGAPRASEIIFTAPTGEELRNKQQLRNYVKSHPGGPSLSEFDWSTGEMLRRSSRIREKAKVTLPKEIEPKVKRQKKSANKQEDNLLGGTSKREQDNVQEATQTVVDVGESVQRENEPDKKEVEIKKAEMGKDENMATGETVFQDGQGKSIISHGMGATPKTNDVTSDQDSEGSKDIKKLKLDESKTGEASLLKDNYEGQQETDASVAGKTGVEMKQNGGGKPEDEKYLHFQLPISKGDDKSVEGIDGRLTELQGAQKKENGEPVHHRENREGFVSGGLVLIEEKDVKTSEDPVSVKTD